MSLLRVLPSTLQKLGLSQIDPLPWRDITLPFPQHYGDGKVKLSKLQVGGFSRFTIDDYCNSTGTHDTEISIPLLNIVGQYQLDGKILGLFPMHRSGSLQIQIQDLTLSILILIKRRNGRSIILVEDAQLTVGNIEAYVQNMEGEELSVQKEVFKLITNAFDKSREYLIQYTQGVLQVFLDNAKVQDEDNELVKDYEEYGERPVMPPWLQYGRYPN